MFLGFICLFNQDLLIWHMKVYVYTKQKGDRSPLFLGSSGLAGDTDLQYHVTGVIQEGCTECCRNTGWEQSTRAGVKGM